MATSLGRLGLVIRSGPWQGRSNREQLDFALAAAALGTPLELIFVGQGLSQLYSEREADSESGLAF